MSERRTARKIHAILARIEDLLELARRPEIASLSAPEISSWTVGRQIEHLSRSAQAIVGGMEALLAGKLVSAGGGPSVSGWVVLLTGWIPRGKARAPEQTIPADAAPEAVTRDLEDAHRRFRALEEQAAEISASRATYRHPMLGSLRPSQWLSFTSIHHDHHAKIIAEIRRAAS